MNKKHPLPIAAFASAQQHSGNSSNSSSNTSMCFPNASNKNEKHHPDNGTTLCGCQKAPKSHCISATGVLLLVLLYTAMGSILFVTLEAELDDASSLETAVAASKPYPRTEFANADIRSRTVDRLWSITEDLNILYKENWTRLAAQEVQLFQDTLLRAVRQSKLYQTGSKTNTQSHKWTYSSAFLYSLTLITTIGYGGVSPRTQWGRVAALIYALFGIPVVLLYLSSMGEGLAAAMRCIIGKARTKNGKKKQNANNCVNSKLKGKDHTSNVAANARSRHISHIGGASNSMQGPTTLPYIIPKPYQILTSPTVPISICVMVLVCYIASGALLFHKLQNWSILEALYFCFTSLGTIGFGELTPTGNVPLFVASAYILIGMAVVALCFNLIQFEIMMWLGKFGVQDRVIPQAEDLSLVSVALTPKAS